MFICFTVSNFPPFNLYLAGVLWARWRTKEHRSQGCCNMQSWTTLPVPLWSCAERVKAISKYENLNTNLHHTHNHTCCSCVKFTHTQEQTFEFMHHHCFHVQLRWHNFSRPSSLNFWPCKLAWFFLFPVLIETYFIDGQQQLLHFGLLFFQFNLSVVCQLLYIWCTAVSWVVQLSSESGPSWFMI